MAVYTQLTEAEIKDFLAAYALGDLVHARGITRGVENSNYLLQIAKDGEVKKYILTVFEKRVRPEDLPFFTGLMEHIALKGFPCPLPLHGHDGNCLYEIRGKKALIVSFLEGDEVKQIAPHHGWLLGEANARLHEAAEDFVLQRANDLSLSGWQKLYAITASRLDEIAPGLAAEIKEELEYLQVHWPDALPRGIIHADLFPDNVFFDGEKLSGVIDFYFSCNDFLMYDLAIMSNAWCFDEAGRWQSARNEALFAGYNSFRRLSRSELEAFPILARGAALRFLLTRAHDWLFRSDGAQVNVKDPMEYLHKLRFFSR